MRNATSIILVLMFALIIVMSGCQKAPEARTEAPAEDGTTEMAADSTQMAEVCETCGKSPCECEGMEEPAMEEGATEEPATEEAATESH